MATADFNPNYQYQKQNVQWRGIEPPTSAVLKPRHNQLDHLCFFVCYLLPTMSEFQIHIVDLRLNSFNDSRRFRNLQNYIPNLFQAWNNG